MELISENFSDTNTDTIIYAACVVKVRNFSLLRIVINKIRCLNDIDFCYFRITHCRITANAPLGWHYPGINNQLFQLLSH
jgi:hypothetical protein